MLHDYKPAQHYTIYYLLYSKFNSQLKMRAGKKYYFPLLSTPSPPKTTTTTNHINSSLNITHHSKLKTLIEIQSPFAATSPLSTI